MKVKDVREMLSSGTIITFVDKDGNVIDVNLKTHKGRIEYIKNIKERTAYMVKATGENEIEITLF